MNLLLMSFFFFFFSAALLPFSLSDVCLPTWTVIRGVYSSGGLFVQSVTQLQFCLAACERTESCLAVDFDQQYSAKPSCWLHNSPDQLFGPSFRNDTFYANKTQYRIRRNCSDLLDEDSVVVWDHRVNTSSGNGVQVGYWTEYDCFTFCRYRSDCVAVDFDGTQQPPCRMHTNPDDLRSVNVDGNTVQYRLNKTNSTLKHAGRCIGQWFPNATWCQPGAVIQIQSASFKNHPLCPIRNADDAYPPDASWLSSIVMEYFDRSYYNEIKACNGSSQCYLRSKCPGASIYDDPCEDPVIGTNYVSISYTCFFNGSTTQIPMRTTPFKSAAATPTPNATDTVDASNVGTDNNNNNNKDIIIGVVVGVGVPLVIATIIVIVVAVIKHRRSKKKAIADNDVSRYYYDNSTTQRGVYPEYEINEISMNAETM